jgi:alkylation response protein AidB-like acyl-CoA dehydrogenase
VEVGREDLTLAKLAEAHWDAVAILAEAGRIPVPLAIYGVWASEREGEGLELVSQGGSFSLFGTKRFCTGAGLIDRALVTVRVPEERLIEIGLRRRGDTIRFDDSGWKTSAFSQTRTATAVFDGISVWTDNLIGDPGWYLRRPGFWHGTCGPAACWAGGGLGLVDYARQQSREDPHSLAHLGAMQAAVWGMESYLKLAGSQIDQHWDDVCGARARALIVRHLVEQGCTGILQRLPRAYGPYPLAMEERTLRRYHELELYLRQSHAERDLELLGREIRRSEIRQPIGSIPGGTVGLDRTMT